MELDIIGIEIKNKIIAKIRKIKAMKIKIESPPNFNKNIHSLYHKNFLLSTYRLLTYLIKKGNIYLGGI